MVEATDKMFDSQGNVRTASVEYIDLVNNDLPGMVGVQEQAKCLLGEIQASVFNEVNCMGQKYTILLKICKKNEPQNISGRFQKLN